MTPKTGGGYNLEYYLKDHLFSNRIIFADMNVNGSINAATEILEENTYYPYGLEQSGLMNAISSNTSPYQYSGKEMLAFNGYNMNDYGARYYDAALGRWNVMDELSEKYHSYSPYNFVLNNPLRYVDPDGKGVNGGFSVTNNSNQETTLIGNNLTTTDKGILKSEQDKKGPNKLVVLQPWQKFIATYSSEVVDGVTIEKYDGNIVDSKTGKTINKNVGIYDVDYIKIDDEQIFQDENGEFHTKTNTEVFGKSDAQIKLSPKLFDGGAQKIPWLHIDPDKGDRNEGNIDIVNNKQGYIEIKPNGEWANNPIIKYGEKVNKTPEIYKSKDGTVQSSTM
ncbi:MAG: RHS repeat-associated core domain-containing protein [Bacteroidetes bacterium]|nr:RHS repeat-associated core domain-containing protein [Bacteroidota bacterium]